MFQYTIVLSLLLQVDTAKILAFFPTPSLSHQVVFRPFIKELSKNHQVTVITTHPSNDTNGNITQIDVFEYSYPIWRDTMMTAVKRSTNAINQYIAFYSLVIPIVDKEIESDKVQELIKSDKKFDLLILESCFEPTIILSEKYKVPFIFISSLGALYGNYEMIGAPKHTVFYPEVNQRNVHNFSTWDVIIDWCIDNFITFTLYLLEILENELLIKHFGPDSSNIQDLKNNLHMLYLNVNPLWEGSRPSPLGVVNIGPLYEKTNDKLTQDLQNYLNSATNGVIFVSFGTNVKTSLLLPEKIRIILDTLYRLPYHVLLKWDSDILPGKPDNVRIEKWFPQANLLKHPNIKLIITHCGLQTTYEAIDAGVPLIGIPIFGDQWYNADRYLLHKIGIKLNLETLTEDQFKAGVDKVLADVSYKENILKLRELMRDQPQSPLSRAVAWTEHVLTNQGAKHLRSPAANMRWAEYYEVKFFLGLLSVFVCLVYLCSVIGKLVFGRLIRKFKFD